MKKRTATFFLYVLLKCNSYVFSQPALPQRYITIESSQPIHFGTFCVTNSMGGTISVGYDGSRSSTGNVVLLPVSPIAKPAIFEIKICQGRSISINFSPFTYLFGSNGGSILFEIGPTEKGGNGSIFITNNDCDFITPLRVGGTLHISGYTPSGVYSGNFDIILIQE